MEKCFPFLCSAFSSIAEVHTRTNAPISEKLIAIAATYHFSFFLPLFFPAASTFTSAVFFCLSFSMLITTFAIFNIYFPDQRVHFQLVNQFRPESFAVFYFSVRMRPRLIKVSTMSTCAQRCIRVCTRCSVDVMKKKKKKNASGNIHVCIVRLKAGLRELLSLLLKSMRANSRLDRDKLMDFYTRKALYDFRYLNFEHDRVSRGVRSSQFASKILYSSFGSDQREQYHLRWIELYRCYYSSQRIYSIQHLRGYDS